MHTIFFKNIQIRLEFLRTNLLPSKFNPTGEYKELDLLLTESYVLLTHAEIESYIEETCQTLSQSSVKWWKNTSQASPVIIALLASNWIIKQDDNIPITIKAKYTNTEEVIDSKISSYIHTIRENHGIKQKNLEKLLIPVGINFAHLENEWVNNMEYWGATRGKIAHTSLSTRTKTPLDPQDVLDKMNRILEGIKVLDQEFVKLFLLHENAEHIVNPNETFVNICPQYTYLKFMPNFLGISSKALKHGFRYGLYVGQHNNLYPICRVKCLIF